MTLGYARVGYRKTMVRRERWLLSRDGRHTENQGVSLWLIAVTQIQFAFLAVADADTDQVWLTVLRSA
jgi:hypothetical protein